MIRLEFLGCVAVCTGSVCSLCVYLQDMLRLQTEGEPRLVAVVAGSESVLPGTSTRGQQLVRREVDELRADWQRLTASLTQVRGRRWRACSLYPGTGTGMYRALKNFNCRKYYEPTKSEYPSGFPLSE